MTTVEIDVNDLAVLVRVTQRALAEHKRSKAGSAVHTALLHILGVRNWTEQALRRAQNTTVVQVDDNMLTIDTEETGTTTTIMPPKIDTLHIS